MTRLLITSALLLCIAFYSVVGWCADSQSSINRIIRFKSPLPAEPYITFSEANNKQSQHEKLPTIHGPQHHHKTPKNFVVEVAGYAQGDYIAFAGVPSPQPQVLWRSTEFFIDMQLYKVFQLIGSYEFAHKELEYAALAFTGIKHLTLSAGHYEPWFGLSNNSSTDMITFMELSLPIQALAPPYSPGISAELFFGPVVLSVNWFGPSLNAQTPVGKTPYGETIELGYVPIHTKTRMFQLSASLWDQGVDSSHSAEFEAIPELFNRNEMAFINTHEIDDVSRYDIIDGSAAMVYGPFSAQTEYVYNWVSRTGLPALRFNGYYVTASYFLTGESRIYGFHSLGFIGFTHVRHCYGAWQLALRFSRLNLTSFDVAGGTEQNITMGLNWYPNNHMEILLNYVRMHTTPDDTGIDRTGNLFGLRLQAFLD